jgi:gliding motility-associated-like protein
LTEPGCNLGLSTVVTNAGCNGGSDGSIDLTVTGATGVVTYSWSNAATTEDISGLTAGAYTITVTDASGCTATASSTITQPTQLTASSSATPIVTVGGTTTLTVTAAGGTAPYTGTGTFIRSAGTFTFTVTDAHGCTATTSITLTEPGCNLGLSTVVTNAGCNGGSDGSIDLIVTGATGAVTYSWSNAAITEDINGLIAGTYTVTVTDASGCTATASSTITQPTQLTASSSATPIVTVGGITTVTVTAAGGTAPYTGTGTFTRNAGTYTFTVADAHGCTATTSITLAEPGCNLSLSTVVTNASCSGRLDGTITITANGGNGSYQYSIDGVNFQSSNTFNVTANNYTVTVKDQNNCVATKNVTVDLNNDLIFSKGADTTICEGGSAQLIATSNATSFSWTPSTALNNFSIANPVASPVTTTDYTVTATLGGCSVSGTIKVTVNPAPVPNAGPDANICFGQNVQLAASGGASYQWTPSTYLSSSSIPNPTVIQPQQTTRYTLQVKNTNGCTSLVTDDILVKIIPSIKVSVSPKDSIVAEGDQVQLNATSIGTSYNWTNSSTLSNPNIPNPIAAMPEGSIGNIYTYTVTATTSAGCSGTASVTLKVYKGPDIYLPTGFTPNGDGKNDRFHPLTVGIKKINYFRVFNRWGQIVFSSTSPDEGWDGKLSGSEQPTGVYVWMVQGITRDNKVITKKGTVMLIK